LIYHQEASQLPEVPFLSNGRNNTFCSNIDCREASTNDALHFCNSSCYSVSEAVTFATALNTQSDVEVSPFEIGERLFHTNKGHTHHLS